MIPHFRSGNYAEGLSEGVVAVHQVLDGSYDVKPDGGDRSAVSNVSWGTIFIFYCVFMLLASASVLYQLTSYRRQYPRATAVEEYGFLRVQRKVAANGRLPSGALPSDLEDYMQNMEKELLLKALADADNNKTRAAEMLGISFRAMRYKLKKLGID